MKDKRWLKESRQSKLLIKLQEEMGEVADAFLRGKRPQVITELEDVLLITNRLYEVLLTDPIEKIPHP